MKKFLRWGLYDALLAFAVLLGVATIWGAGLGKHVTADEPMYVREAGGFYVALQNRKYAETNRVIQPGVPTLWMGAWAFDRIYPEYAQKGEVDIADFHLYIKLEHTSVSLMDLLTLGRLHMVRLLAVVLGITAVYLRRLFGQIPAVVGLVLIVCDPFLFGHSTLLATDAPLAVFAFGSVVGFLGYIRSRRTFDLIFSAVMGGLAVLSKVTGLFLVGFVGVVLLVEGWRGREKKGSSWIIRALGVLTAWCAVLVLACFAVWPALWQEPGATLSNLLHFTVQSIGGEINSNTFFMGETIPGGDLGGWRFLHYYPQAFLWRTTPLIMVGLGLAGIAGLNIRARKKPVSPKVWAALWLAGYVLLYTLVMNLSSKKFDRYLLPVFPALAMLAGLGWAWVAQIPRQSWKPRLRWRGMGLETVSAALLLVTVMVASWVQLQRSFPAPLNSYNPLMGTAKDAAEVFVVGWGEGLEQAAAFLNKQQNAKTLKVYSWYAAALNVNFVGRAEDIPISPPIDDALLTEILAADYVVVYAHQYQRQIAQPLLDALADQPTIFVVEQDGVVWVKVYDMQALNLAPLQPTCDRSL